jgi:hypothetical protein
MLSLFLSIYNNAYQTIYDITIKPLANKTLNNFRLSLYDNIKSKNCDRFENESENEIKNQQLGEKN